MLEVGQVSEAQKRPLPPRPRTPTHIHRLPLHRNIPTLIGFKVVRIFEDQKFCQVIYLFFLLNTSIPEYLHLLRSRPYPKNTILNFEFSQLKVCFITSRFKSYPG